ncbi:hypothetical protein, partial [Streptomyces durhamensis]
RKGDILAQLTQTLTTSATDLGVDVVLVTPDRALFSAAQHYRRERYHWALDEAAMKDAMRLGRLAIQGHLALFLGAGVSIGAGLPGWSDLLARLAERSNVAVPDSTRFPALDQAQLLEKMIPNLGEQVSAIIAETSTPSLA